MVKCLRLSLSDQEHANSIHCTGASQIAHLGKEKKQRRKIRKDKSFICRYDIRR